MILSSLLFFSFLLSSHPSLMDSLSNSSPDFRSRTSTTYNTHHQPRPKYSRLARNRREFMFSLLTLTHDSVSKLTHLSHICLLDPLNTVTNLYSLDVHSSLSPNHVPSWSFSFFFSLLSGSSSSSGFRIWSHVFFYLPGEGVRKRLWSCDSSSLSLILSLKSLIEQETSSTDTVLSPPLFLSFFTSFLTSLRKQELSRRETKWNDDNDGWKRRRRKRRKRKKERLENLSRWHIQNKRGDSEKEEFDLTRDRKERIMDDDRKLLWR